MSQFDPAKQTRGGLDKIVRRIFPERQFLLRSGDNVKWIQVSTKKQILASLGILTVISWGLFTTEQFVTHRQIITAKDHHIGNAYAAYETLVEQVDGYRARFEGLTSELERNHAGVVALTSQSTLIKKDIARLKAKDQITKAKKIEAKLASIDNELKKAERERLALKKQVSDDVMRVDREVATLASRRGWMSANPDVLDVELRKVVLQRDLALSERDELDTRSDKLVDQLAEMQNTQMLVFNRFADLTNTSIGEIENMLAVTGLDVNQLLSKSREELVKSQGGPFIPAEYADLGDVKLNARLADLNGRIDRWDGLQKLQRMLPIGAPLERYQVTSYFGNRRDPFNGRMGRHEGLDLGAPMLTPVQAVAPGKVIFVGWKARYGKTVIVDHGMGFSTLYGHLHSTQVEKGAIVNTKTVVAKVGNSGRSTGPHLHYEVRVNDAPRNPLKFMKAGRHVFKG